MWHLTAPYFYWFGACLAKNARIHPATLTPSCGFDNDLRAALTRLSPARSSNRPSSASVRSVNSGCPWTANTVSSITKAAFLSMGSSTDSFAPLVISHLILMHMDKVDCIFLPSIQSLSSTQSGSSVSVISLCKNHLVPLLGLTTKCMRDDLMTKTNAKKWFFGLMNLLD